MAENQQTLDPARERGTGAGGCSAFDRLRLEDATVHAMLKAGRTLEETIVSLVCEKRLFIARIMELEMIAPRLIKMPDGRILVWRCPDHLIPEEKMPNKDGDRSEARP